MRSVKIGILGAGFVANTFHVPAFNEIEGAEVVAAFSHKKEVAEDFAKRWKIGKVFSGEDGIAKLCADPEIEVVDIALPNNLHLPAVLAAAESHKSMICEKPLARNEQEARKMVEAVEKAGVLGFYAENQVFIPQVSRARALIERGVLGQVYWVRCREAQLGQRSTWFYDPAVAGGGAMLDPGVHAVEVASYLMGKKPVSVMGWTAKLAHATPGEDNALVLMKFKESELAQAENTWVTRGGLDLRFEVHGGNGSLYITVSREAGVSMFTAGGSSRISGAGETVTEIAETKKGVVFPALGEHRTLGFVDEMRHFLAAASKGEKGMLTFQDGCSVNAIIDAAYRSAKSGGWESTKEG